MVGKVKLYIAYIDDSYGKTNEIKIVLKLFTPFYILPTDTTSLTPGALALGMYAYLILLHFDVQRGVDKVDVDGLAS